MQCPVLARGPPVTATRVQVALVQDKGAFCSNDTAEVTFVFCTELVGSHVSFRFRDGDTVWEVHEAAQGHESSEWQSRY